MKKLIGAALAAIVSTGALAQDWDIVPGHVLEYRQSDEGGFVDSMGFEIEENFTNHGVALTGQRFVYNDPRRASMNGGDATVITYSVETNREPGQINGVGGGPGGGLVYPYWNSTVPVLNEEVMNDFRAVGCGPALVEVAPTGRIGEFEISQRSGRFGSATPGADIRVIGFRNFVADVPPSGYSTAFTLGFVVTFFYRDIATGALTDIDNDGRADIAFREVYYNGRLQWTSDKQGGRFLLPQVNQVVPVFSFYNIALHEIGHTLSLDHFGTVGYHKDELVVHPDTVMRPVATAVQVPFDGIEKRTKAQMCAEWAGWETSQGASPY